MPNFTDPLSTGILGGQTSHAIYRKWQLLPWTWSVTDLVIAMGYPNLSYRPIGAVPKMCCALCRTGGAIATIVSPLPRQRRKTRNGFTDRWSTGQRRKSEDIRMTLQNRGNRWLLLIIRLWIVKVHVVSPLWKSFCGQTNHCNEIGERLLVVAQLIALKKLEPLSWGHSHGSFTHDDPMIQVGFSICPTCMHNCSFQEYIRNP